MRIGEVTSDRLERQESLIDLLTTRIEERQKAGEPVELSMSVLDDERRLYRRMVGQAAADVLREHVTRSRFT